MGVWGPGNFQRDAALDYMSSDIVKPLVAKLREIVDNPTNAEPDDPTADEVMVAVEILCVLCERCRAVPPGPGLVEECRSIYLKVWDGYIDRLSPKPEYKKERRDIIEASFAELARLAHKWHEVDP